jgi:hypothetical protein
MIDTLSLRDRHRRTLAAVFAHPTAHNLAWYDVVSLLGQLGDVSEVPNGKLRATVSGHAVSWEPQGPQLAAAEVLSLRRFLQQVGVGALPAGEPPATAPDGAAPRRGAVVITYRNAQVYGAGGIAKVEPFDPHGRLQHMHEKAGQPQGFYHEPQPEYYARIADALRGFDEVLLLGHGKGHSSALAQLTAYLEHREPELAQRVVGRVDLDVGDLTEAGVGQAVQEYFRA